MKRVLAACSTLILLAVLASAQNAEHAALLADKNPDNRVEGAKRLITDGDKKSVKAVLDALVTERDGFAGREMGLAFSELKGAEGLNAADSGIMGFKKTEEMFAAYWALCGLARGGTPEGLGTLKKALTKGHKKDVSLRACALEAIGESGRAELAQLAIDAVNAYKVEDDNGNVFENLSAITAVRKLCPAEDKEAQRPFVEALIHILDLSKDERIKYFAAMGLGRISGQAAHTSAGWWRAWLAGNVADGGQGGKTVAFFDAVAVGNRVLFVIDVSGSMEWPADMDWLKNPITGEKKAAGPDYSQVRTKLDLAKVELLWTLKNLPEDFYFNIITYSKDHQLILADQTELVQATEENKRKFSIAVYGLKAEGGTNIHGALVQSFGVVRKGKVKEDPALDPKAMLEGVDTIFFMTDGEPSWSDDSTDIGEVHPKWGGIGNGRFCKPDAILADIARINTFRKVVIHAIAVGKDAAHEMMKTLAEQNHGNYVNRG
jgi:hypothetical protein